MNYGIAVGEISHLKNRGIVASAEIAKMWLTLQKLGVMMFLKYEKCKIFLFKEARRKRSVEHLAALCAAGYSHGEIMEGVEAFESAFWTGRTAAFRAAFP